MLQDEDPYVWVEKHVLRAWERHAVLAAATRMNPRLDGAKPADVLAILADQDAYVQFTDAWFSKTEMREWPDLKPVGILSACLIAGNLLADLTGLPRKQQAKLLAERADSRLREAAHAS